MGKDEVPEEGWSEAGAAWLESLPFEDVTDLFWLMDNEPDNEKDEETLTRLLDSYAEATGYENEEPEEASAESDDDEEDDDDAEGNAFNVWDAADIYFDSGFDEDRMFGYSHEELNDAHEAGG